MILSINEFKYTLNEDNFCIFNTIDKCFFIGEDNRNFEWDFDHDVKKDITLLNKLQTGTVGVAKYVTSVIKKMNKLPHRLKLKLFKAVAIGFMSILTITQINTLIDSDAPDESKQELKQVVASVYNKADVNKDAIDNFKEVKSEFNTPTMFSDELVDFLKYEEGSIKHKGEPVLTAYTLGDGMVTIGYGHAERTGSTSLVPGTTTITKERAEELLVEDMKEAKSGLDRLLVRWKASGVKYDFNQGQYDAMVSMIYNMGIGKFLLTDFIQDVKKGNYETAAERILTTNANYPGLVTRRKKESELFIPSV